MKDNIKLINSLSARHTYEEKELLQRVSEGGESAFTTLFGQYSTSLGALAYKVLQDEAAKQDVLQEVFIKLWLHRDQLPEVHFLAAWLKKITLNEALIYLRKNAAYDKRLSALKIPEYIENGALQSLEVKELQQRVGEFIKRMPEQRRTIFELNRLEGLSAMEIAAKMNLSYGHVRNSLSIAVKSIRQHLELVVHLTVLFLASQF
ncbi:RNA polymerase sigma factor [Chitinophaga defluvii]|uniref:Sigma-70 family RNA polymerase sigma factor n=1 Tax=Chitinophaga defluvii TaxID=3163343 RepID=A0ABV2TDF7_9BACT